MPNVDNLKPFGSGARTREEELALNAKGGVNSGVSRNKAKSLRECAAMLMSLPVEDKRKLAQMVKRGVPQEDANNMMLLVYTAFKCAVAGSPKWGKMLFDLLEKETSQDGGDLGGSPLGVFLNATSEDMNTDDLPEVQ